MERQMTTAEALMLLNHATQPQNAGKITREGYAQLQIALEVIAEAIKPSASPSPETK
jgi:hypothetical protein